MSVSFSMVDSVYGLSIYSAPLSVGGVIGAPVLKFLPERAILKVGLGMD